MATDAELLEGWRNGDTQAGSMLFERYFSKLYRFFRTKTHDGAEDLVQETLLGCVRGRDRIHSDERFRAYLFATARKVLYKDIHRRVTKDERLDFGVSSLHDLGTSPSQIVLKKQEQALLVRCLRRIPIDLQVALELYYFEGMRGPELADALEIPEGTVRSRLRRATALLKTTMAELAESDELLHSTAADLDGWASGIQAILEAAAQEP